jgi:hypothetical protein
MTQNPNPLGQTILHTIALVDLSLQRPVDDVETSSFGEQRKRVPTLSPMSPQCFLVTVQELGSWRPGLKTHKTLECQFPGWELGGKKEIKLLTIGTQMTRPAPQDACAVAQIPLVVRVHETGPSICSE